MSRTRPTLSAVELQQSTALLDYTGLHIQFDFQVQNTLAQVCQSVDATGAAFIQFGMDDEKVQLIAEKVVDP